VFEKKMCLLTQLQVDGAIVDLAENYLDSEVAEASVGRKRSRSDMDVAAQSIFGGLDQSQLNTLILTCFDLAYEEAKE
jgi:hypothetical protein